MQSVTIAGFEVWPEQVLPQPMLIGGGNIRRAINGTGYLKIIGQKGDLALVWSYVGPHEFAYIQAIFQQCAQGPVAITCADPYVNGTFLFADPGLMFKPTEGGIESGWVGSMSFKEA